MTPGNLSNDTLLDLYRTMLLIRRTEERLGAETKSGDIPGSIHLYIGQEAVAAGVCAHLSDNDKIASNHRGHGHYLAKGGSARLMIAEIYGRATGICGGKGGSMHVADVSRGILGANGIVGGGIGIAAGAALAAQLDQQGAVSVVFFGDGGANQGVLAEALNVGAIWKLPLVLVCENNGFSEFSPTSTVTAGAIMDRAKPFGLPGIAVDGNDVVSVWQVADVAVRRARSGDGPTLIEARTYRIRGHVEKEESFLSGAYRDKSDVETWQRSDPILRLRALLTNAEPGNMAALDDIERRTGEIVEEAFAFARTSAEPPPEEATQNMFA